MNSQPSSCLGCFSGSELAQSGPIWSMGRWVNRAPPSVCSPSLSLPKRETCSPVFSTFPKYSCYATKCAKTARCLPDMHEYRSGCSLWGGQASSMTVCCWCFVYLCCSRGFLLMSKIADFFLSEQMISFDEASHPLTYAHV